MMSVLPPGGNPATIRTAREGQASLPACAWTVAGKATIKAAINPCTAIVETLPDMLFLPFLVMLKASSLRIAKPTRLQTSVASPAGGPARDCRNRYVPAGNR